MIWALIITAMMATFFASIVLSFSLHLRQVKYLIPLQFLCAFLACYGVGYWQSSYGRGSTLMVACLLVALAVVAIMGLIRGMFGPLNQREQTGFVKLGKDIPPPENQKAS